MYRTGQAYILDCITSGLCASGMAHMTFLSWPMIFTLCSIGARSDWSTCGTEPSGEQSTTEADQSTLLQMPAHKKASLQGPLPGEANVEIKEVRSLGQVKTAVSSSTSAPQEVTSLPGWGPTPLPSKIYSGFIEVDRVTGANLFYVFVSSQSHPDTDPLIWWMNGGPGASSLVGLLQSVGPFLLNNTGNLVDNPYSWSRTANLLFVEFAPGVGFSYCKHSFAGSNSSCKQSSSECSPCDASDSSVANQNVIFIEKFLAEAFPAMAGRPLYLAGESYAGVYIPTLAIAIVNHFADTSIANLKGLWVTDPCTSNKEQFGWLDMSPTFAYQKGLISPEVYATLTNASNGCFTGRTEVGDLIRSNATSACKLAWRLYDLALAGLGDAVHPPSIPGLKGLYIDPLNAYGPAGGPDLGGYLNATPTRKALHAEASPNKFYHVELGNNGYSNYFLEYAACNDNYIGNKGSMIPIYRELVGAARSKKASAGNLTRIIISGGDLDPVVITQGT